MSPPASKNRIDLKELHPDQRRRVERILNPHDITLGTRHSRANHEKWRRQAKEAKLSLRAWVEQKLNA